MDLHALILVSSWVMQAGGWCLIMRFLAAGLIAVLVGCSSLPTILAQLPAQR